MTNLTCLARLYTLAPSCNHELLNAFDLARLACSAVTCEALKLAPLCLPTFLAAERRSKLRLVHGRLHSLGFDCFC